MLITNTVIGNLQLTTAASNQASLMITQTWINYKQDIPLKILKALFQSPNEVKGDTVARGGGAGISGLDITKKNQHTQRIDTNCNKEAQTEYCLTTKKNEFLYNKNRTIF